MLNENQVYVNSIRNEIEKIYDGEMYKCPVCGEMVELIEEYDEDGEVFCKLSCGDSTTEELEQYSFYEYFEDVLDITYYVGSDRETVNGVRLMVAYGGPNVYVDTFKNAVELFWYNERATADIYGRAADAITECFEDVFHC